MAGFRASTSTIAGARDIVIGFVLTTVVVLIALALWPHTGVAGNISEPDCTAIPGSSQPCSLGPARASITVNRYALNGAYRADQTWQTKSDATGNFHIDNLPPGGYWLFAQANDGNEAGTSFPVYAGKVTQVQLLIVRSIGLAQCLAATDRIATPAGYVPVTQVRPGMIVWTLDASGQRVAAPVLLVTHIPAPIHHYILRVTLLDGRVVEASPGHPMLIGRRLGDLKVGDNLDGSPVISIEQVPYSGATWDLLPAGSTGAYWANDVLLGSTLRASWLALQR